MDRYTAGFAVFCFLVAATLVGIGFVWDDVLWRNGFCGMAVGAILVAAISAVMDALEG